MFFVPAFNGLLAPHWQDDARGVILGITSYTKAAHIVRAMLEAIAWQVSLLLPTLGCGRHAGHGHSEAL